MTRTLAFSYTLQEEKIYRFTTTELLPNYNLYFLFLSSNLHFPSQTITQRSPTTSRPTSPLHNRFILHISTTPKLNNFKEEPTQMDSLPSVPPSIILPQTTQLNRLRLSFLPTNHLRLYGLSYSQRPCTRKTCIKVRSKVSEGEGGEEDEEVEKALHMDGRIPGTSNEFVKQVSSRAYDMRRNLHQTFDSSSYDVLEANPWRESSKPVYVLTQKENQLCTMKTRQTRSEVERELGLLFSRGRKSQSTSKQSGKGLKFQMLVEDVREGILVFEDIDEAAKYCDLLGGKNCEGVAEIEASSVFDLCNKMKALAVLFRRGRTPPLPESLKQNLRARKRSLEDQEDV